MLRRPVIVLMLALLAGGGSFAAMPFLTVWQIREALLAADTATLAAKVDWPSVRRSLKQSVGETRRVLAEASQEAAALEPSFWQRVKLAVAPAFTEPLIDRYVTAENAPRLFSLRQTWRHTIRPSIGLSEPKGPLAATAFDGSGLDRALAFMRRIERASFVAPTRVEIDLRDARVSARRWRAVMTLEGLDWRLVEVHVLRTPARVVEARAG